MHAEKCPVCYGSGKAKGSFTFYPDKKDMVKNLESDNDQVCSGCKGKDWVEVLDAAREVSDNPQYYAPVHYDRYQKNS